MRAPHSRLFLMEDDLFMKKPMLMLLVIALLLSPFAALGQTMEPYETIDLDLSQMSGTIAYAQVYQMVSEPENYVGKIIRMRGICYPWGADLLSSSKILKIAVSRHLLY